MVEVRPRTPRLDVAIVGRPNVGKSTLFNRLVGGRRAIVHNEPGVTRDRLHAVATWRGRCFTVSDTGGLDPDARTGLGRLVAAQVRRAIHEAAVVLFVVDAREGISPLDLEIARLLREQATARVIVVANKVDGPAQESLATEFFRLGFSEVLPVSAEHGLGVAELADLIVEAFPPADEEAAAAGIRVAVVGRPNVGKSSLINRLLEDERVIVSEEPGTTRDVIDTPCIYEDTRFVLLDTAGIRARGRERLAVERFSEIKAIRAIERSDVTMIVLDGPGGIAAQDAKIAAIALEAGCGAILVVNKWDLMPPGTEAERSMTRQIRERLRHLEWAPIAFVSALTGYRTKGLFPLVKRVAAERARRIPTPEINALIGDAVTARPPPSYGGRAIRIRYATQAAGPPPTFVLFVNEPRGVPDAYRRYLVNRLRQAFGFVGTPIRVVVKGKRGRSG